MAVETQIVTFATPCFEFPCVTKRVIVMCAQFVLCAKDFTSEWIYA